MPHVIPDRWMDRVRQHVLATTGDERDHLLAYDFDADRSVRISFPDGSYAFFRYAFHLRDEREVAVFTEHCGYHFFATGELEVEVFATVQYEADEEE